MTFARTLLALFTAAFGLAACGSDDVDGSPESLQTEVVGALCQLLIECNYPLGSELDVLLGGVEGCTTELSSEPIPSIDGLIADVEAGDVDFDRTLFRDCLDEALRTCAEPPTELCREAFRGTVPDGGSCHRDEVCEGDAFCDFGEAESCPGTCTARRAPGGECDDETECSTAGATGVADCEVEDILEGGRCVIREVQVASEGERCGNDVDGVLQSCRPGLWCNRDGFSPEGVCAKPLPEGASCQSLDVCVDGAVCAGPDGERTCQVAELVRMAGAPCNQEAARFCDPTVGLICESGTCAVVGPGSEGAACEGELFFSACEPGLRCADGVCIEPRPADDPCTDDGECASDTCTAGTCAPTYCAQ